MEAPVSASSTAFAHLADALGADTIIAASLAVEEARSEATDALLLSDARIQLPGLVTTALMSNAAHVARSDGRLSFDRLERAPMPPAPGWRATGLGGGGHYDTALVGDRLVAHPCWPFRQDGPLGDFGLTDGPKWWTHGQVHALIGGAYWPELSEWELAHMARLSEAVASWHWYWLSELDRRYCPAHRVSSGDQTPDCDACRHLESEASRASVRQERLRSPEARATAANGLEFLRYEAYCYDKGLESGELVIPQGPYLSMGEACDYARLHRPRLTSSSHARWVEACLIPGEEYARSTEEFSQRAAAVAQALITPQVPPKCVARARARRVIQDIAARLCHGAALEGSPLRGFERGLEALVEGLDKVANATGEEEVRSALAAALHGATESLASAPERATQVLALGYQPTLEPDDEPPLMRAARIAALHRRADAIRSPVAPLLRGSRALSEALISIPRSCRLVDDSARAADTLSRETEAGALTSAFTRWLCLASRHWGPDYAAPHLGKMWTYRLAHSRLGPASTWDTLRVRPNPYLTTLPCPFDIPWLEGLLQDECPETTGALPILSNTSGHVLVGQGPEYPLVLPWTDARRDLLNRLEHTPTVNELLADGLSAEALTGALEESLVVVLEHKGPVTLEVAPADEGPPTRAEVPLGLAGEDPGPWEDAAQAAYYDAFCDQSTLYEDLADALLDLAEISPEHHIVDLGCGTGSVSDALRKRLGDHGRIVAIDPAPRMLQIAKKKLRDPRVHFELGTARRMVQLGGPYDRIICNSAIWLDPHLQVPLKAAQLVLAPGGRLAFSLPAEFLGHRAHWESPSGEALARAMSEARRALLPPASLATPLQPTPHPDILGSDERLESLLLELGFVEVQISLYERPWSVSEYIDWLAQPLSLATMCPGGAEVQRNFIERVRAAIDGTTSFTGAWSMVIATRDESP